MNYKKILICLVVLTILLSGCSQTTNKQTTAATQAKTTEKTSVENKTAEAAETTQVATEKGYELLIDGKSMRKETDWNASNALIDLVANVKSNPGRKVEGKFNGMLIKYYGKGYELYADGMEIKYGSPEQWLEWNAIEDYREMIEKGENENLLAFFNGEPLAYLEKVTVLPVFFVPSDSSEPTEAEKQMLDRHMLLAQEWYKKNMKDRDSFVIEKEPLIYKSPHDLKYLADSTDLGAAKIVTELMERLKVNRYSLPYVLMVIVMNPNADFPAGGGRPINGYVNSGGGIVLASSYTFNDPNNHFQSTLEHELGHAFGLVHADVYGYDQTTSESIMSYNENCQWRGFDDPFHQCTLIPEDLQALARNKLVFPKFYFDKEKDLPTGYALKPFNFLPPMDTNIERIGYQLFFDGVRVGHEPNWNSWQAIENLIANKIRYPDKKVTGKYGINDIELSMTGYELFSNGQRVLQDPNISYDDALEHFHVNQKAGMYLETVGVYNGRLMPS
jgi:hypothetical protein